MLIFEGVVQIQICMWFVIFLLFVWRENVRTPFFSCLDNVIRYILTVIPMFPMPFHAK